MSKKCMSLWREARVQWEVMYPYQLLLCFGTDGYGGLKLNQNTIVVVQLVKVPVVFSCRVIIQGSIKQF